MMRPRRLLIMKGSTERHMLNAPSTFVASTVRMSSSLNIPSRPSRMTPALFTRTSMRSVRASVSSTNAWHAAESRTSTAFAEIFASGSAAVIALIAS